MRAPPALDEIGELPLDIQVKLLRVLQSGEYERVGGDKTLRADVRIIAASNRDLEQAVRELENVLERAIILTSGASLQLEAVHLGWERAARPQGVCGRADAHVEHAATGTMQDFERAHILRVCESTGWKIKGPDGAAHILGLTPGTLYLRMKRLGIRRP